MKNIKENLELFGLKQKEIEVYLFLLSNQDIPAYKISTGTKIPRTTVYSILDILEKQGLVSKWSKNSVKYFSAENPKRLVQLLEIKNDALSQILPDLEERYKNKSFATSAKIFVGKEGVKYAFDHILETMLREKIKIVYAISETKLTETIPKFFLKWRAKKNKKTDAITKMIVNEGTANHAHYKSDEFRETREMPKYSPVEGSLDIIGNNIYFFSFKEGEVYSIIIESPIVAGMMRQMFEYIWNTLKESPKD